MEGWSGGVVEWWSGGVVEWWSGGVVVRSLVGRGSAERLQRQAFCHQGSTSASFVIFCEIGFVFFLCFLGLFAAI